MSDIILSNASFDVKSKTLIIGKQGENVSRSFVFDFSAWESAFGEGTLTLFVKRHGDSAAYPVLLSISGNKATWNVLDVDTAKAGTGALEIRYAVDGVVVKSETFNSYVYPSITATDDPAPDPYESWIETLVTLGETTQINAQRAEAAAQTYPYIDSVSKHWMVWDVTSGEYVDTGISAEGQGGGGGTSDHSQLTNRSAANQHPISAITGLQTALDGKGTYSKPSGGIPKNDFSNSVKAVLDLADTAIQADDLEPYATTEYVDGDINDLQEQIDAIVSRSDVVDVVGTYAELLAYDTSSLGDNDVVKVLDDSTHGNARSYYRWHVATSSWEYVGSENIGYTKAEADTLLNAKQSKNIGAAFAGQFLIVGADGNITTQSLDVYEGGSY